MLGELLELGDKEGEFEGLFEGLFDGELELLGDNDGLLEGEFDGEFDEDPTIPKVRETAIYAELSTALSRTTLIVAAPADACTA